MILTRTGTHTSYLAARIPFCRTPVSLPVLRPTNVNASKYQTPDAVDTISYRTIPRYCCRRTAVIEYLVLQSYAPVHLTSALDTVGLLMMMGFALAQLAKASK